MIATVLDEGLAYFPGGSIGGQAGNECCDCSIIDCKYTQDHYFKINPHMYQLEIFSVAR
jgi:hypothetical protein